jgi:hypothetical protein
MTSHLEPTPGIRWMGVGRSSAADTATAADDAVRSAADGRTPALVVLFVSTAYDLADVARSAQGAVGAGVPVVGCTTSGEIAGTWAGSGHVVALALGGDGLTVRTSVGRLADGAREAGRTAARGLDDVDRPYQVLMLLSDGMAGPRSDIVRGAYGVAGAAVPLIGGCAGDDLGMQATYQLCDGEVRTDSVVGVAIGSEGPIGVGIGHGWQRAGEPLVVTESDGQRIFTLDDEPALDAYLRAAGAPAGAHDDPGLFNLLTLSYPLGLPRPGGEEVRAVLGADAADRSLLCADVPQGTVLSVMEGEAASILVGTRTAAEQVLESLGGAAPVGVVAFDCAARRAILGDDGVDREVAVLAEHLPDVPLAGFYTYGEYARLAGSRGVHNSTLVLLAFA